MDRNATYASSNPTTPVSQTRLQRLTISQESDSCSNVSLAPQFFSSLLVLLCHKFWCPFRAAQHGQRESVVARAATNLRRIVAIEFGTWRSGRNGGASGLVTFA